MIKMNKSNNNAEPYEIRETIICPVCKETSDIVKIDRISVDDEPIRLHKDVGDIWQCERAECMEYLIKVKDKYEPISRRKIIEEQEKITKFLAVEAEVARVPSFVEAEIAKADAGRMLSFVLYHLTSETMHHRAYSVEEILEACKAIGFNPLDVDNRRIGFVLNWLRDHKKE